MPPMFSRPEPAILAIRKSVPVSLHKLHRLSLTPITFSRPKHAILTHPPPIRSWPSAETCHLDPDQSPAGRGGVMIMVTSACVFVYFVWGGADPHLHQPTWRPIHCSLSDAARPPLSLCLKSPNPIPTILCVDPACLSCPSI